MVHKSQAKRFEEMAREVEADASAAGFDKLFGEIVPPKPRPKPARKTKPDPKAKASS